MDWEEHHKEMIFIEEVLNRVPFDKLFNPKFRGYPMQRLMYIRKALDKYGELWVISAIIEGSVGYHTYESAKNMLEYVLESRFWLCERTSCIFDGDASLEIAHDIYHFEELMERDPERVRRIMELVRRLEKLSWEQAVAVSLMYPTIPI
ncbi:MAG: hypothetical protein QXT14_02840 [Candidatus Bathyarchaeia archaeon]